MAIPVTCPSCGARLNAPNGSVGGKLKCPKCGGQFVARGPPSPVALLHVVLVLPAASRDSGRCPGAAPAKSSLWPAEKQRYDLASRHDSLASRRIYQGAVRSGRRATGGHRSKITPPRGIRRPGGGVRDEKRARRRIWPWLAAAALLLAVGGAASMVALDPFGWRKPKAGQQAAGGTKPQGADSLPGGNTGKLGLPSKLDLLQQYQRALEAHDLPAANLAMKQADALAPNDPDVAKRGKN